ncbi:MAG TPA: hypothetical protein VL156_11555, partial [Terriglobales bacterium]|nr:hypothetical protein [Terriglobales bacterium]
MPIPMPGRFVGFGLGQFHPNAPVRAEEAAGPVVLQKQFFGATELPPTSSVKLFGSQSEDFTNELNLAKHIPFRQPPD